MSSPLHPPITAPLPLAQLRDTPTEAHMRLTGFFSHRGDGIPTQRVYPQEVCDSADTLFLSIPLWLANDLIYAVKHKEALTIHPAFLDELCAVLLMPCPIDHGDARAAPHAAPCSVCDEVLYVRRRA